jgi:pimeloyl-ACP methyl ester carboxylesterase
MGERGPLLIVGGFGGDAGSLEPLRARLAAAGWQAEVVPTERSLDHGEVLAGRLIDVLEATAAGSGRPVALVGHSRGGQVGRVAARRRPDLVARLVALASPLNGHFQVSPSARARVAVTALLGSLGVPGLLHVECLWATCCQSYRDDIAAPFPPGIPFTSIYTRADRTVPWRASRADGARLVEVDSTHDRIVADEHVLDEVVGALT